MTGGFAAPPGPPAAVESASSNGWTVATALTGLAALIGWGVAIIRCYDERSGVDKVADNFFLDASAVQISQVADQAMLVMIESLAIAGALTVLFAVVTAIGLIARR